MNARLLFEICYFWSVPFWIARRSNWGAQRIGMPEKTAISLEHDGENKVRMLDPEWVEQLFASLAGTLWRTYRRRQSLRE